MSCSYPHNFYKISYIKCESDINPQKAYPQLSPHYPQIFPAHQNGDDSSWSSCYPHVISISKFQAVGWILRITIIELLPSILHTRCCRINIWTLPSIRIHFQYQMSEISQPSDQLSLIYPHCITISPKMMKNGMSDLT